MSQQQGRQDAPQAGSKDIEKGGKAEHWVPQPEKEEHPGPPQIRGSCESPPGPATGSTAWEEKGALPLSSTPGWPLILSGPLLHQLPPNHPPEAATNYAMPFIKPCVKVTVTWQEAQGLTLPIPTGYPPEQAFPDARILSPTDCLGHLGPVLSFPVPQSRLYNGSWHPSLRVARTERPHKPSAISTWSELSNWWLPSEFPGTPSHSTSCGSGQGGATECPRRRGPLPPGLGTLQRPVVAPPSTPLFARSLLSPARPSHPQSLLLEWRQTLVSKQHINCFLARFQMISQNRAAQFEQMERRKEGHPATGARAWDDG